MKLWSTLFLALILSFPMFAQNVVKIPQGGTGAKTAGAALVNLFPGATRVGDVLYCKAWSAGHCSDWEALAGNNSSVNCFAEIQQEVRHGSLVLVGVEAVAEVGIFPALMGEQVC